MSKKILYSSFIGILLALILVLSYYSLMYFYTQLQIADAYTKYEIFEQMERQVRTEYAFFTTPAVLLIRLVEVNVPCFWKHCGDIQYAEWLPY